MRETMPQPPDPAVVSADARRALAEDFGTGDVTADLLAADAQAQARVIARNPAVICRRQWFDACFRELDPHVRVDWRVGEGVRAEADAIVCEMRGQVRALVGA